MPCLHGKPDPDFVMGKCIDIDRNNVPAARENGLVRDLNLTGSEYPTLLSLLYVGYILVSLFHGGSLPGGKACTDGDGRIALPQFQIPSNIIVEKTGRPSIYLPVCIVIWGKSLAVLAASCHSQDHSDTSACFQTT